MAGISSTVLIFGFLLYSVTVIHGKPIDCGCGTSGGGFGGYGGGVGGGYGGGCGGIPPTPPISFQPVPQPIPIRIPSRPPPSVTIPNIILALLPPNGNKPCVQPSPPIIRPPPPLVFPLPQPYPVPICDNGCGGCGFPCGC